MWHPLLIAAKRDIFETLKALYYIAEHRSLQLRVARAIYPGIILGYLETYQSLPDIAKSKEKLHAGIKSRSTFNKYVQSLNITVKKPGIVSKRHYITWRDAERLRQLKENPERLEELRYPPDAEKGTTSGA